MSGSARPVVVLLALSATALVGCVGLPHLTAADAQAVHERWPEVTAESLAAGRAAYVQRCSGCHALHLPQEKPPEEWPAAVREMEKDAKVKPGERVLIEQYLMTASAQLRKAAAPPLARAP